MALFPENSIYFDEKDIAVKQRIEKFHTDVTMMNQEYQDEAAIDVRFNAGDQTLWSELYNVPLKTRQSFTCNRIKRNINLISGFQRRERRALLASPQEGSDQDAADQTSKLLASVFKTSRASTIISDAFEGAIISGINFIQLYVDYRNDPISGDIKLSNCGHSSIIIDPYFREKDLSDCNAIWKRSYMPRDACASLIPNKRREIEEMETFRGDGKFNYMPESVTASQNLMAYDEFYYRDYRKQKQLVDPNTNEVIEWDGDDDALEQFLKFAPEIKVLETMVPTVKLALLVNGKVMYDDVNPLGLDSYPFIPVFGYFHPDVADFSLKIQGVVRGLRDVQYLYNRRKVIEYNLAESRTNSGFIAKEGALKDPDSIIRAGDGRPIIVKRGYELADIAPIPPIDIPQSFTQLSQMLADEIQQISGVNEELLGFADDDISGMRARMRQAQGVTTLQTLYDNLEGSMELLGTSIVQLIQKNYAPSKVKRIINEEPHAQFYTKLFSKFDIVISEGFDTINQRQNEFGQLLNLRKEGIQIPDSVIIEAAPLQNKKNLVQAIEQQNKKTDEMEQMRLKSDLMEQQATTNMINARAESDSSLAKKRASEIKLDKFNMLYKSAESSREEQKTNTETIKTLKELEQADPNRIDELLELLNMIQQNRDMAIQSTEMDNVANQADLPPQDLGPQMQDPAQMQDPTQMQGQPPMQEPDPGQMGGGMPPGLI